MEPLTAGPGPVRIVVLTGAGISAESGLPTFRDADGLWEGHDPMLVATPESFAADPDLVQRFYDERRAALARVEPNAGPPGAGPARGGARRRPAGRDPERRRPPRAGRVASGCVHMHGRLRAAWCTACDARHDWTGTLLDLPALPGLRRGAAAARRGLVRRGPLRHGPDRGGAVGLRPLRLDRHVRARSTRRPPSCSTRWRAAPARSSSTSTRATAAATSTTSRRGPATELVPAWVEELLAGELGQQ